MSILITSLDKPDRCVVCPLFKSTMTGERLCKGKAIMFGEEDTEWLVKTTPNWCPIVEIPPHGDLIERDALKRKCQRLSTEAWKTKSIAPVGLTMNQFIDFVEEAPSVIPAEKE